MKFNFQKLKATLTAAILLLSITSFSQDKPKERVSPPAKTTGSIAGSNITIDYSRPSVKGRKIWGDLVPFDQVWRTGANEATTFETTKDIKVEGVVLPAGKYGVFTIPGEKEWTVIFNKVWNQWGSKNYNEKEDQLRIKVKAFKISPLTEQLTFFIENNKTILKWENLEVAFIVSKK